MSASYDRLKRKFREEHRWCHYCKTRRSTTVDHIVPKGMGGSTRITNLMPACEICNKDKANTLPVCMCETCTLAIVLWREQLIELYTLATIELERRDVTELQASKGHTNAG